MAAIFGHFPANFRFSGALMFSLILSLTFREPQGVLGESKLWVSSICQQNVCTRTYPNSLLKKFAKTKKIKLWQNTQQQQNSSLNSYVNGFFFNTKLLVPMTNWKTQILNGIYKNYKFFIYLNFFYYNFKLMNEQQRYYMCTENISLNGKSQKID